ncbi:Rad3-related DNA helicase [Lachnospiraceae bacterium C10]|nr:Rad3-related DNA helicase [Lachnospiraceae bacterium C10]
MDTEKINQREQIRISVRNLVEFVLRSGDIREGAGGVPSLAAMQEGSRMHRKIQRSQGANYHSEVSLATDLIYPEYTLRIEGRADGIIYETIPGTEEIQEDREVMIDEIKGIYRDLKKMDEAEMLHMAQAKCYAYMFAKENHLNNMKVQITYVNLDTEEIKRFTEEFKTEELQRWFLWVVGLYKRWSDFSYHWKRIRTDSIHKLEFPYAYRKGQKELITNVYRSIYHGGLLFMDAPTGSGKTIATLFPGVMAMGQNLVQRIFYLTGKTITGKVAKDTLALLADFGYHGKTVILTAKDKICPLEERICDPEHCIYAKGHYDRINDAIFDLLISKDMFDRDTIAAFAEERKVCPFELSLDLSSWSDNIIGDVNYVFDPNVYLKRFFAEGSREDYLFLIDEAHNLVDRGRRMYSADLMKEDFLRIKKLFVTYNGGIPAALSRCNKDFLELKRQCEGVVYPTDAQMAEITRHLMRLASLMDMFFEKHLDITGIKEIREFYFQVRFFLNIADVADDCYRIYGEILPDQSFVLHLYCVDPGRQLQQRLDQSRASVFFSATMMPLTYYRNLLCRVEHPYAIYAQSHFPQERQKILIGRGVTTTYKNRSMEMYDSYASYIKKILFSKKGNYMIFFPSYGLLHSIAEPLLKELGSEWDVIEQESHMSEQEREAFLEAFTEEREKPLAALCVMGGIFGEGIDLTGKRLIGAVIVGVGLPMVSLEQKILQAHFEDVYHQGFDYAYLYPGMNKVLQAAGRVIRTATDAGVVALLDDRYSQMSYRRLFPRHWQSVEEVTMDTVEEKLKSFWEREEISS